MAVNLYKDAACTEQVENYYSLFNDVRISPFGSSGDIQDSVKVYAKKDAAETQEHFCVRGYEMPCLLEASVGSAKSFFSSWEQVSSGVFTCEDASKFSVGDFVTNDDITVAKITAISGNQITLNIDLGLGDGYSGRVSKIIPLGDTTSGVEITLSRTVTSAQAMQLKGTWYSFTLTTLWEE